MLYIGEKLGNPDAEGPDVDVAVDPLEGTTIVAKGHNNAMSVIAIGDHGTLLHAPDMYMMKMAVGKRAAGKITLYDPVDKKIEVVAEANNKRISDVTVIVQERERHQAISAAVREKGDDMVETQIDRDTRPEQDDPLRPRPAQCRTQT